MELSKRLYAVAGLVTEGASVADIGTDHGYVPIYLMEQKIAAKVIAMDINEEPLERARIHIASHGLAGQIETRLSDGLAKISPGEVDTMIAAGMGGGLVIRILEEGKEVVDSLRECILQPQSEIAKVRKYLVQRGLVILEEDMVEEDGKYYPMMRVVHGCTVADGRDDAQAGADRERYEEYEYRYGKELLKMCHPTLERFLLREQKMQKELCERLKKQAESEGAKKRLTELAQEMQYTEKALEHYGRQS